MCGLPAPPPNCSAWEVLLLPFINKQVGLLFMWTIPSLSSCRDKCVMLPLHCHRILQQSFLIISPANFRLEQGLLAASVLSSPGGGAFYWESCFPGLPEPLSSLPPSCLPLSFPLLHSSLFSCIITLFLKKLKKKKERKKSFDFHCPGEN